MFSFLPISFVMTERIYILCLIIIIKSKVWTITHCLGLGHETLVCAVCLSIFFWNLNSERVRWIALILACSSKPIQNWLPIRSHRASNTKHKVKWFQYNALNIWSYLFCRILSMGISLKCRLVTSKMYLRFCRLIQTLKCFQQKYQNARR